MQLPMVPIPVPSGVQPWVSWIFVAVAIGALVLIVLNGIRRLRAMDDRKDEPPKNDEGPTQP